MMLKFHNSNFCQLLGVNPNNLGQSGTEKLVSVFQALNQEMMQGWAGAAMLAPEKKGITEKSAIRNHVAPETESHWESKGCILMAFLFLVSSPLRFPCSPSILMINCPFVFISKLLWLGFCYLKTALGQLFYQSFLPNFLLLYIRMWREIFLRPTDPRCLQLFLSRSDLEPLLYIGLI